MSKSRFTRILSVLLIALMLAGLLPTGTVFASDVVDSGDCGYQATWKLDSDGVLTITGTGKTRNYERITNCTAPWKKYESSIKRVTVEYGITCIGDYSFYGCGELTSVTLPESVRYIGDSAFWLCEKLSSINIPNSLISIGRDAFDSCTSLPSIAFPITLSEIGGGSFYCCNFTSVTIPRSMTYIRDSLFNNCHKLTSVTLPDSILAIESAAFSSCTTLPSIIIPDSVTSIGEYAFNNCYCLTSITIPSSVTRIDNYAFKNCPSTLKIRCEKDSAAHKYAVANNIGFELPFVDVEDVSIIAPPTDLIKGKTAALKVTVTPSDATNSTVTWTSSNTDVATVDATGKVTAKSPGTAKITAAAGTKEASCDITVHTYVSMRMGYSKAIQNGTKGYIDSTGTKPLSISGKTMLPLRFVSEKLGATVTYISDKKPITVKLGKITVKFTLGSKTMEVINDGNKSTTTLDVAAQIYDKKTYIPLRAIGKALGFDVFYDAATKIIIVNNPKMTDSVKTARLNEAKGYIK